MGNKFKPKYVLGDFKWYEKTKFVITPLELWFWRISIVLFWLVIIFDLVEIFIN